MQVSLKSSAIIALLAFLAILLPFTVYMTKSHFTLSAQLETMTKQRDALSKIGLTNQETFANKIYNLDRLFLNNRYILNNQKDSQKINVKSICEQHNGIDCVLNQDGQLSFVGDSREA